MVGVGLFGIDDDEVAEDLRGSGVGGLDGKESIVGVGDEDGVAVGARTRRPPIAAEFPEARELGAGDELRVGGVGEIEDLEAVSGTVVLLLGAGLVVIVVSRGGVEVAPQDCDAVTVSLEGGDVDGLQGGEVAGVDGGELASTPVARIEPAIAVPDALAFVRLLKADVGGLHRVAHVDELDAVLALADEEHAAADVHAGGKLDRVEAVHHLRMDGIAGVDDPHARLAGTDVDHAVLGRDLTWIPDALRNAEEARLKRLRDVEDPKGTVRAAVERCSVEQQAGGTGATDGNGRDFPEEVPGGGLDLKLQRGGRRGGEKQKTDEQKFSHKGQYSKSHGSCQFIGWATR